MVYLLAAIFYHLDNGQPNLEVGSLVHQAGALFDSRFINLGLYLI